MIFHQSVRVRPHSAAEAAEILRHTLRLVAAGGPKVQRVPRRGETPPTRVEKPFGKPAFSMAAQESKRTPWRSYRVISMDVPPLYRIGVIVVMW